MPGLATGKGSLGTADASGDAAFDDFVTKGQRVGCDVDGVCANARQQRGAVVVTEQPRHLAFGLADKFGGIGQAPTLDGFAQRLGCIVSTADTSDRLQHILGLAVVHGLAFVRGQCTTRFGACPGKVGKGRS
ncbi:hypothetical protein D9M71_339660 [compost metagenome]